MNGELRLTLGWIADAVQGRPVGGDRQREVGEIVTDSRTLASGDFFVALRGPRFDGHAFVGEVLERGAAGALVEAGLDARPALIEVGDVVLIAGKGHEKYQEIGGVTQPFDDVAVAREALEARRLRSRVG